MGRSIVDMIMLKISQLYCVVAVSVKVDLRIVIQCLSYPHMRPTRLFCLQDPLDVDRGDNKDAAMYMCVLTIVV